MRGSRMSIAVHENKKTNTEDEREKIQESASIRF